MYKPLSGKIIVKVEKEVEKKVNGIIRLVSDNTADKTVDVGIVLAVGEGVTEIKVGDKIFLGKYVGTYLNSEGHIVLKESEVDAILQEEVASEKVA
jgi:co-chaperonin GroES (HSP10)